MTASGQDAPDERLGHGRPRLHLTAPEGWINDPLGLTYHNGQYHLFYQHVPGQVEWAPSCHWGHATSPDLLHWTHEPAALTPGDGDDGCWSGSIVVVEDGGAFLFYTSVHGPDVAIGKARLACPADDTWVKWEKGDVVAEIPPAVAAIAFRDPYVFADGDEWRMLVGAGLEDGTAAALIYTSADLHAWSYDGLLTSRSSSDTGGVWVGSVWECPQLFALDDKYVLTVSVWEPWVPHYEAYAIGTYRSGRFTPETWGRLTYGPSYYAGSAFADRDGCRGLIYWLRGVDDTALLWAGANSVPHLLELEGDRVVARPHPNLDALRVGTPRITESPAGSGIAAEVSATSDIEWDISAGTPVAAVHLADREGVGVLTLLVTDETLTASTPAGSWEMPILDRHLRILLDGPACEVFTRTRVLAVPVAAADEWLQLRVDGAGEALVHALSAGCR
jgi:beta-fructofuranosidase